MLEKIIESKTESAVLSFFLAAPQRAFSVFEISKRLGIQEGKCSHALSALVAHGQLKSFSKKNKKYYMTNSRYSLMPAIKEHLLKNGVKYEDELFAAIKKLGDIRAAYLSGLFAGQPALPVDILLVGKVNLAKMDEFLKRLQKVMGQEINYSIMSEAEFKTRRNTFDRFIKDIFDYNHLVVFDLTGPKR